jgi:hypothetical protein
VLYAPAPDPSFSLLADRADRLFSLSPPVFPVPQRRPRGGPVRHPSGLPRDQTTLEGF